MSTHPALRRGRTAVVTGGASGIGLAAAKAFARLGMNVCIADLAGQNLERAEAEIVQEGGGSAERVRAIATDVSRREDVERLKEQAYAAFNEVAVLMNNAGIGGGGGPWQNYDRWQRLIEVNLWGVINGIQTFLPAMIEQGKPGAIISTGSKQGITTPPGDTAYNVSKAGVKVLTEAGRPRAPKHRPLQDYGAPADPRLHVHGYHGTRRETYRCLVGRAGRRLHDRRHGER
jgi:NAD(P)-dependent dehydrogenase (short-subunit alcohol dehydrogenase family)